MYQLTIIGFTKDFENAKTASVIAKTLIDAGFFSLQTGHARKNNKTSAFVAVKSQSANFETFNELCRSMNLLNSLGRNHQLNLSVKTN